MELFDKIRKAYQIIDEQGFSSAFHKTWETLFKRPECAPQPIIIQEWLSYYQHRNEIPLKSNKEKGLFKWPKVSILILTYNNFMISQLCLRSIYCNTTYPNYEVIVVDNASSDETPDWLKVFSETHSNLRLVLNSENRGFAGGNNQAARLAKGEYLIFLNNDTVVTTGWVEHLLAHMQNDPEVGLVGPVTNSIGNEARISVNYHTPAQMEAFAAKRARLLDGQAFDIRMLAFYCVMTRKEKYEAIGCLDERYLVGMFEDDDLAVRYRLQHQRVVCAEDVFIHHFQGASFGKLDNDEYKKLFDENRRKYEEKWGRAWEPYQFRQEASEDIED